MQIDPGGDHEEMWLGQWMTLHLLVMITLMVFLKLVLLIIFGPCATWGCIALCGREAEGEDERFCGLPFCNQWHNVQKKETGKL